LQFALQFAIFKSGFIARQRQRPGVLPMRIK
jgi:hypothetical protein